MSNTVDTLPTHWGIRLLDFPRYGLMRVQSPSICPRCGASTIDATLDPYRNAALAAWVNHKTVNPLVVVIALILVVVTLGAWLVVMGLYSLCTLPMRMGQKRDAQVAAKDCIRSHCRSCGIDWYASETASIEAANKR